MYKPPYKFPRMELIKSYLDFQKVPEGVVKAKNLPNLVIIVKVWPKIASRCVVIVIYPIFGKPHTIKLPKM